MTASNLQSEPYSAIYPYVLLSIYRLLVCQVCGFASSRWGCYASENTTSRYTARASTGAGREYKTDSEYYPQSGRPTSLFTVPNGYNSTHPVSCAAKTRWFKMPCLWPYSSSRPKDIKTLQWKAPLDKPTRQGKTSTELPCIRLWATIGGIYRVLTILSFLWR